jgi:hypothetical protein
MQWGFQSPRALADQELELLFLAAFFDVHVFEFAGLEDLAALLALDELRIFIATDDLHTRVLTRLLHICALRGKRRL